MIVMNIQHTQYYFLCHTVGSTSNYYSSWYIWFSSSLSIRVLQKCLDLPQFLCFDMLTILLTLMHLVGMSFLNNLVIYENITPIFYSLYWAYLICYNIRYLKELKLALVHNSNSCSSVAIICSRTGVDYRCILFVIVSGQWIQTSCSLTSTTWF